MTVTRSDVEAAHDEFMAKQTQESAAIFMSKLREAEEDGELDPETFYEGLASVEAWLWKGGSVVTEVEFMGEVTTHGDGVPPDGVGD